MKSLSIGDRIFNIINYSVLTIVGIIMLFPFWYVLVQSVIPYAEKIKSSVILFPTSFDFSAYKYVLSDSRFLNAAFISIFVTVVGTVYQLFITAGLAYGLTKKDLPFNKTITILVLFTMFFNGGLIPTYLVIKKVGLINNIWVMIIPAFANTYNLIIIKNFFEQVPKDMEESAIIDGAGVMTVFFRIILPLSKAALATIGLFIAVGQWNNYYSALIYLQERAKWPLAMLLQDMLVQNNMTEVMNAGIDKSGAFTTQENVKMAVIIVSVIPIISVYPFIQKYFTAGVMVGAIKE